MLNYADIPLGITGTSYSKTSLDISKYTVSSKVVENYVGTLHFLKYLRAEYSKLYLFQGAFRD